MIGKRAMLLALMLLIFATGADAKQRVAYIYQSERNIEPVITALLNESFDLELLAADSITASTNFSGYAFITIGDERFTDPYKIPVNKFPALVINTYNVDEWKWVRSITCTQQNFPIHLKVVSRNPLTEGMPDVFQAYTSAFDKNYISIKACYLSGDRAAGINATVSTLKNANEAVIAVIGNGTRLLNKNVSTAPAVFFGAVEIDYWTEQTATLFRNSAQWLAGSRAMPEPPANTEINYDNRIMLSWDHPEPRPDHYSIYVSDDPDSFNFTKPAATTGNSYWEDNGYNNESKRFYIVRSATNSGREDENQNTLMLFRIHLREGYNLISIPLIPKDNSFDAVILQETQSPVVTQIMGREIGQDSYLIAEFYQGMGWWSSDGSEGFHPGQGYWLKASSDFNLTVVGYMQASFSTSLAEGPNLVGWVSYRARSIADAINQSMPITQVMTRQQDNYIIAEFYPGVGWWSSDGLEGLEPGIGYWLIASQPTEWTITLKQ